VSALGSLARALRSPNSALKLKVSNWLHVVQFQHLGPEPANSINSDLTTILLRAENLRSLILYADVHPSVMDIVSQVSSFTLRELVLFIDNASSNSLSLIGNFLNLEDLTLMVFSGYHIPHDSPNWHLTHLKTLLITGRDISDNSLVAFLSRCRFINLRTMTYFTGPMDSDHVIKSGTLLQRLPLLRELTVNSRDEEWISCIPPSLKALTLEISENTVIPHLPPTIIKLIIDYTIARSPDLSQLWGSFEEIIEETDTDLLHIQICGAPAFVSESYPPTHPWNCQLLVGLLSYSVAFSAKGIDLLDCDGKTVQDYFKQDSIGM
jgi:hypothetical protein